VSNAREIYERVAGKKELVIIPTMGHHPSEKDIKLIYPSVRAFLKRHLKL
jgi:pimeloyl-ACP methyl ester carboxylesterase